MPIEGFETGASGDEAGFDLDRFLIRPRTRESRAPCIAGCAAGGDPRRWIGLVAQRDKLGLDRPTAFRRAWETIVEMNPLPATLGRVCPHPCQASCNRSDSDGAVAINAMERFLGDWALEQRLPLSRLDGRGARESVGVVGSGPAGLSFAYQMARRGYAVTIYERHPEPGGMLRYGIPPYRLPDAVLRAEIRRIEALGVELRTSTRVGRDLELDDLRERHAVVFLGIGAQTGRTLGIPGEDGPGVWTGTDLLARVNRGERVDVGPSVAIVGGGNTAVDAARAVRRLGARATLLYRRTRAEMPAIEDEIEDALDEGVAFEFLVGPVRIERSRGRLRGMRMQRMELGEPDASGRRSPRPVVGSEFEIEVDDVIVACAQTPDWSGLERARALLQSPDEGGGTAARFVSGGDVAAAGIAAQAIAQGRNAAEIVHARLRGLPEPTPDRRPDIDAHRVRPDAHTPRLPAQAPKIPAVDRLADPAREVVETIDEEAFVAEARRCLSCGLCYGCERCFTYCNGGAYTRLEEPRPGAYFALALEACEGCAKCVELCPCGYLVV